MKKIVFLIASFADIETGAMQVRAIGIYDEYHEDIKEKIIKTFACDMRHVFKSKSIINQMEDDNIEDIFNDYCILNRIYEDKDHNGVCASIYVVPLNKIDKFDYYEYGGQ